MPLCRWLAGLFGPLALTATALPADPSPPTSLFFPTAPSPDYSAPQVALSSLPADVLAGVHANALLQRSVLLWSTET